ncbi:TetR/AcrR family transcriptional regulator [Thermodesulfobacteriota bacterium]
MKKKNNELNVKKSLLESGISLFTEKGYASTSVREIVERAGVSKPVLYYYFKNKEGLFHAILNRTLREQEAMLAEVLEATGSCLERMILLFRRIHERMHENQDLPKMIHNLIFGPPQGAPDYDLEQYHQRMVEVIKVIYLDGLEKQEVEKADPEEVAFLALGLFGICFHLDQAQQESFDPERPVRLLQMAFKGLDRKKTGE